MIVVFNGARNVFMDKLCTEFGDFVTQNVGVSVTHISDFFTLFMAIVSGQVNAIMAPATSPKNILVGILCRIYGVKYMVGIHDVISHEKGNRRKISWYNKLLCILANEILVFSSFSQDQLIKLFGRSSQVYRFGAKNKYLEPRSKDIDVIVFGRMLEYQGVKRLPAICRYLDDLKIVLASKSLDPSDFDGLNCTVIPEFIEPEMLDDLVLRSKVVMMPYESATQSGHVPYSISRFCIPVVTAVGALPEQVQTFNSVIFDDKEFSAEKYAELVRLNVNKDRPDSLFYQWLEYQKNSNMLLSEYISKDFLNG